MSNRSRGKLAAVTLVIWTVTNANAAGATPSVTTWRYDIGRTGQNQSEMVLTPSNVNNSSFGKLYTYAVDGYVYAQPLYLPGLVISGQAHNVVFIATQHDSVYAFDADHSQQLWKASLIDSAHGATSGATTVPSGDIDSSDIVPEIGITGTPVIDPTTNTFYVAAKSKERRLRVPSACARCHHRKRKIGEPGGDPSASSGQRNRQCERHRGLHP